MALLSVFTPTHDPRYLADVWSSLRLQRDADYEWVVCPTAPDLPLPAFLFGDPRIRVVSGAERLTNTGAVKKFAVERCRGFAFVELDHDDLLAPGDTLAAISRAFLDGADFVYSDDASFLSDGMTGTPFDPTYGWENYQVSVYGRRLTAVRAFEPDARSLCEIYYSPDHVRCWSRDAYERVGGYDATFEICEDADLMMRTYLAGASFVHVGGCRYFYRRHEANTVTARRRQILERTLELRRERLPALVAEWCRRKGLATIDLDEKVASGWKFDDLGTRRLAEPESVGCVTGRDVLHLAPRRQFSLLPQRAYEALAPGGWLDLRYFDGRSSATSLYCRHGDFPHFTPALFAPFYDRTYASAWPDCGVRFQRVDGYDYFESESDESHEIRRLRIQLCALKGQRQPGRQLI